MHGSSSQVSEAALSTTYIRAGLRRLVAARADNLCEYCLLHEDDILFGGEVDHIISEKHGGLTREDNLAYACFSCNRNKGSDIASLTPETSILVRFFAPRQDLWHQHFYLDEPNGMTIVPLTEISEATARIFSFNEPDRLLERRALQIVQRYPTPAARRRINPEPNSISCRQRPF